MITLALLAVLFLGQPADDAKVAWTVRTEPMSFCCCEGQRYMRGQEQRKTTEVVLIATLRDGRIRDLDLRDPSCPMNDVTVAQGITSDASLDALRSQLDGRPADDGVILGIAVHDNPRTIPMLLDLARRHRDSDVRKQATFWLGQRAGDKAAADLRAIVDEDPEDEVRERAVFAISQLPRERSVPMLVELVRTHRRPAVREKAMFWLAQTGDPRALDLIADILGVE